MLNRINLIGRLTQDPELRHIQGLDPRAVTSFGLAVDRDYRTKDGKKITDFFNIVAWHKKAEFISKYFHKGQLVYIDGRLQRDTWEDKENNKRTTYKIIVENCYFADSKKSQGDNQIGELNNKPNDFEQDDEDDLPI